MAKKVTSKQVASTASKILKDDRYSKAKDLYSSAPFTAFSPIKNHLTIPV